MTNTATPTTTQSTSTTSAGLPGTDVIDAQTLRDLVAADPLVRILDVRTGGEFDSVHVPGSYNVPLDTLSEHARDLADLEHPVVLVCKSGARADQAHTKLTGAGKQRLHLLEGGLDAWIASGGDVVRGTSETWAMDRQVRLVAGTISLVGILTSIFVPKAKWLAGGVAAGLTFSAVSNTCAMGNALARLPYNKGRGCDVGAVLDEMRNGEAS
ncbi:rhodanese-like domain-containing protein [Ilumatobacter coccineus]|jgi:rhodanese-related sulfurtransferase|uniref:rhodanese-like domain-containing protein n=1 Tax=Ilumatobacter coccineus TaxID=467094 RepID=UPI000344BAC4|nr:rhodanese-like domain-containing protein [Ilumatobacter coccineus]